LEGGNISIELGEPGQSAYGEGTQLNKELSFLIETHNDLMNEIMGYQGGDTEGYFRTVWTPKFTEEIGAIFNANKNNDVGTLALMHLNNYGAPDMLDEFFDKAGKVVTSRGPIQKILQQRAALKETAEGMLFTDFTIEDSDGETVSFSDYIGQGKYVLVDFWAGWCGPCKREIPHIREVYDKHNGENFTVLGVAVWEEPRCHQASY